MSSDYINEHFIAEEIFVRLPVKSLMRFRCLSKSWCRRISSPEFIRTHTLGSVALKAPQKFIMVHRLANPKSSVAITIRSQDQLIMPLSSPPRCMIKDYEILASCHGILCLQNNKDWNSIRLLNPSISYKFDLPRGEFCLRPPPLTLNYGFGCDHVTNDYKVVRISLAPKGIEEVFVYSMRKRSWCEIALPLLFPYTLASRSCYVNGALYWISHFPNPDDCIVTFDLNTHVLGTIALPKLTTRLSSITVLKGCLAIVTCDRDCSQECIWEMKNNDVASNWSLAYKSKTTLKEHKREGGCLSTFFDLTNGDFLCKTSLGKCNVCNFDSSWRVVLYTVGDKYPDNSLACVLTYVDSLALLDTGVPVFRKKLPFANYRIDLCLNLT